MLLPVVVDVAVSLDMRIAHADDDMGWLAGDPSSAEPADDGPSAIEVFWGSVRALVMGRGMYESVFAHGEWPYETLPCWVCTTRPLDPPAPHDGVRPTTLEPAALVAGISAQLEAAKAADGVIWLMGGGRTVARFEAADAIDRWRLSIMPTRLGAGTPLWPGTLPQRDLRLIEVARDPGGWARLVYERRG